MYTRGESGDVRYPLLSCWWRYTILFTGIYPLLETLKTMTLVGKYHNLPRSANDLISLVGRDPIGHANHQLWRV